MYTYILCNWALLEWRFSLFVNSIYLSSMQHRHVCTVHALYFKKFVLKILFIKEYIIKLLRLFCICMYLISSRLQAQFSTEFESVLVLLYQDTAYRCPFKSRDIHEKFAIFVVVRQKTITWAWCADRREWSWNLTFTGECKNLIL